MTVKEKKIKKEKNFVKNKIFLILNKAKKIKEKIGYFPSILIEGRAGVGKSSSVKQWALENNFDLVDIRLINYDVGDFMLKVPDKETLKNKYNEWLIKLATTEKPTILLLDEIDKASETIQRLAYQLILDREVEGLKLSNGVMIVAIQNTTEDGGFNDLRREKPLWDRFFFRIRMDLDIDSFLSYAYSNFSVTELVAFLEKNKEFIYIDNEEELVTTPRRWEMVDKALSVTDLSNLEEVEEIVEAVVNKEIAIAFRSFLEIRDKYNIEKIVKTADYNKIERSDFFLIGTLTAKQLIQQQNRNLIEKHIKAVKEKFGNELLLFFVKILIKTAKQQLNSEEYNEILERIIEMEEIENLVEKMLL